MYPLRDLRAGMTLSFEMLAEFNASQPFHVLAAPEALCFVSPVMKVTNLGGSLLLTYPSWQTSHGRSIDAAEVYLSFKHPSGLYAFTAMSKVTLITDSEIEPKLHEFLTLM